MTLHPRAIIGGKFSLQSRLGRGAMGEVWLAVNTATDAEVAIKIATPSAEADDDREISERFRGEAQLGARLSHRNVVRVFDFLEAEDGALVLVMELLRGRTVEDLLLERTSISPEAAVAIAHATLLGLQHAHDAGSVHRDVKPANVFLSVEPDGHVTPKVFDFGIAKLKRSASLTAPGIALGTPRHMSPEQVRGKALDARSDVFAVGILLYEMMTGASPFEAASPDACLTAVLERDVDADPRIPSALWLEMKRALRKAPYERHASAKAFADAIRHAMGDDAASLEAGLQGLGLRPDVSFERRRQLRSVSDAPRPTALSTYRPWFAGSLALFTAFAVTGYLLARRTEPAPAPRTPSAVEMPTPSHLDPAASAASAAAFATASTPEVPSSAPEVPPSPPPAIATTPVPLRSPPRVPTASRAAPRSPAPAAEATGSAEPPKKRIATTPGF